MKPGVAFISSSFLLSPSPAHIVLVDDSVGLLEDVRCVESDRELLPQGDSELDHVEVCVSLSLVL